MGVRILQRAQPHPWHSAWPWNGRDLPTNRTTGQRMADSFRVGEMCWAPSCGLRSTGHHSPLCRLFRKGPCPSAFDSGWFFMLSAADPGGQPGSSHHSVGAQSKWWWGRSFRPLLSHSYLSSVLMQWKKLQKSSYQKNMKPVERAAFSRLGDRPLNKPWVPSSCSTCLVRSRRPL